MRKVGRYIGVGHGLNTGAIDRVLGNRKGFSYFEENDDMIT